MKAKKQFFSFLAMALLTSQLTLSTPSEAVAIFRPDAVKDSEIQTMESASPVVPEKSIENISQKSQENLAASISEAANPPTAVESPVHYILKPIACNDSKTSSMWFTPASPKQKKSARHHMTLITSITSLRQKNSKTSCLKNLITLKQSLS